jgi:hypothetical protein
MSYRVPELQRQIKSQIGCESRYVTTELVATEIGDPRPKLVVDIFDLLHHPAADRAYAWVDFNQETKILLKLPPITSAEDALKQASALIRAA